MLLRRVVETPFSAYAELALGVARQLDDGGVRWDDPAIGIDWPMHGQPLLAAKDAAGKLLVDAECFD